METNCDTNFLVKTFIDEVKEADPAVWNAIAEDPNVKSALAAVATMGYESSDEFHHATGYLLNCISNTYLKATAGKTTASDPAKPMGADPASAQATEAASSHTPAIIFSSARNIQIPGDYLGAELKPDLAAFVGDMTQLAIALRASVEAPFRDLVNFALYLSFSQLHLCAEELDQLDWYLSALKRCRPDLPTVYGLFLDASKRLMIVSVNACGSWSSDPVDIGFGAPENPTDGNGESSSSSTTACANNQQTIPSTDAWIAYVVLLYRTYAERDTRFSLIATNAKPARAHWQVRLDSKFTPTVRPFHSAHGPGRMTWASFALEPSHSDPASSTPALANGFYKTSWQDLNSRFHESKLLMRAHQDSWLPGLVRPWYTALDTSRRISVHGPPALPHPVRLAEHIYLASLGHPLSRCESALHLLKTIYDAAETHFQLLKRGILHGDISWFNILCNPWHDNATVSGDKQVAKGIPCIDYILTGEETSQPCALVLDLDHAAALKALYAPKYSGRDDKTGTPMFVSVELSSRDPVPAGSSHNLAELVDRLRVLDSRPKLLKRAFPDGDRDFMKRFIQVVEREKNRVGTATTDPASLHRPHHDVESLYWILVWGFSRALPAGHDPHGKANDTLSRFVDMMLNHCLGEDEDSRADRLYGSGISRNLLHESLRDTIHPVLQDLGTYLAIPWHLYPDIVTADHAHFAIRRLLLPLIDDIVNNGTPNVFFNVRQPRTVGTDPSAKQSRLVPSNHGTQSSVRPSARVSTRASARALASVRVSDRPISSNSRCKDLPRPQTPPPGSQAQDESEEPDIDYDSDANFAGGDVIMDLPGLFHRPTVPTVGAKRLVPDEVNERAHKRVKKDTRDARDVDALIDMFWDDRTLWFGSGFRRKTEALAVINPGALTK